MKQNDLPDARYTLPPQNLESIFNVYTDEEVGYFYNLLRTVNFPEELDSSVYTTYTVQMNDTWPLIAWKSYGNVKLWWLICSVNGVQNALIPPTTGSTIKVLTSVTVKSLLNNLK